MSQALGGSVQILVVRIRYQDNQLVGIDSFDPLLAYDHRRVAIDRPGHDPHIVVACLIPDLV